MSGRDFRNRLISLGIDTMYVRGLGWNTVG